MQDTHIAYYIMASRSALIVLFSLSMLGSLLATTVAADDVVLERSSSSTAADASSSQGAVPSTPPVSDEVASDASSAVSSGTMGTLPSSPSVSPMSPADDVHSVASDEFVAESTSPAPTTVDADAPSRSSQAEVAEPIGNASSSTDASHVAGDVLTTATPESESPASVERVDKTNITSTTVATTTPEEPLANTTDAITTEASTAVLADTPNTEAQLTTRVDESTVPLADEALPTTTLPTSTDSEVTAQQTYETTGMSTPTAPLETAPPAVVVVVVASTSLQSATASPLQTEGSLSSTSLPPPPSTPPPPTTMAVPLTSGAPPTPSELEARQKAFCRHTTTSSSLRHPIVFGRRVTVSEFLLICKGFVKSPRFLENLRPSQVSALSAAACGVLTATDVGLLGRTFGYVSEECIVSIPGASWRGAAPSSIARLFSSGEGRRSFNLASNISGLTMESILEVERQSGCFSKAQCNSLMHRGQSYLPKVCGHFESPGEPATAGATSPPPTLPLDATVVQTQELAEKIKSTPVVGGGWSTTIVRPTLAAKKGEVGSGPQRLARGDASPSLVMPITAGVIAACLLFTWSHIRRRKPSR